MSTTIRPAGTSGHRDGYGVIRSVHLEIAIPSSRVPETGDSAFIGAESRLIAGLPSLASVPIRQPWQGRCAEARPCSSWARDREPSAWRAPRTPPGRRLARVPFGCPRLSRYGPPGGWKWLGALMQRQGLEARPGQFQFRGSRGSLSWTMPRDYSCGDTNTASSVDSPNRRRERRDKIIVPAHVPVKVWPTLLEYRWNHT